MISYAPLWKKLKENGITTYTLIYKYGMSSHTVYRLRRNQGITTLVINDLCQLLDCRVEDILEYLPEEDAVPKYTLPPCKNSKNKKED